MKKLGILCMVFCLGVPQGLRAQTLDYFIKQAQATHPGIKVAQTRVQVAQAGTNLYKGLPATQLAVGAFVQPVQTRTGPQQLRLGIRQPIPLWGLQKAQNSQTMAQAQVAQAQQQGAIQKVEAQVAQLYYALYAHQRMVQLETAHIALLNSIKQQAQTKLESGQTKLSQVLQVDLQVNAAQQVLLQLQAQVQSLQSSLAWQVWQQDSMAVVQFPEGLDEPFSYAATLLTDTTALPQHPTLLAARSRQLVARQAAQVSQAQVRPKLNVGLDYIFIGARTDAALANNGQNAWLPTLGLQLPLWQQANRAKTQQAQMAVQLQEQALQAQTLALQVQQSQLRAQLKGLASTYQLDADQLQKAQQIFDLLLTEYAQTGQDLEALLQAARQVLHYQSHLVQTQAQLHTLAIMLRLLPKGMPMVSSSF